MNFLYCFDNRYNVQGAVSIYSLLSNLNEKVDLHIIHNNPKSFEKFTKKINTHQNLNKINIYEFDEINHDFPNLGESHVTYATYFRMFIQNYIPEDIDYLIYIDADVVCMENPIDMLKEIKEQMYKNNFPLAALTEGRRNTSTSFFENLGIQNDKYFNAGIIIIDFQQWIKNNTLKNMLKIMKEKYKRIIYWDQDIMNLHFEGNYLEIPRSMNYTSSDGVTMPEEKIYFHHYAGSKKPWYFSFIFNDISENYQQAYKNLFNNKFHVTMKFKKHEIKVLINILISRKFNLRNKIQLIYGTFKTKILG